MTPTYSNPYVLFICLKFQDLGFLNKISLSSLPSLSHLSLETIVLCQEVWTIHPHASSTNNVKL